MTNFKWSEDPMRGVGVLQQAAKAEAESESRRQMLTEKAAAETMRADRAEAALREQTEEWRERALLRARAEKAEAERDRLKEHWRCWVEAQQAWTEELGSLRTHYESAIRALTMAEDRAARAEAERDSERLRAEKAEGVQWKHDPGNILRASAARLQRLDPYGPTIDFDIFDYDHDEYCPQDSRERGGDPRPSVVVYLPHSCNEWVIGGAEHVKALVADLQQALIDLEAWRP